MVTKEEAVKKQKETADKQKEIDQKQAEIQKNIENRYGRGESTRGYNYQTVNPDGSIHGRDPKTGEYSYNPQTGPQGNIPNDAAQRLESQAVKAQISAANIDKQIADLEKEKAASEAEWQQHVKSGRLSQGQLRRGNTTAKTIASQIASLNAERQSLASKPETRSYSGVMTTSGKIYESAAEAKRQGQTVLKDRQGRDVKFEGDIRASAGYGQSNRGFNYLDTSDKETVRGATPQGGEFVINKQTGVKEGNVPTAIAAAFPWTGQETGKIPVQADYTKNFVTGEYIKSDTGFPVVTNDKVIYDRIGKGMPSDPFRANQPEENRLAGFANPIWTINTKSGEKRFEDKKDLESFIKQNPNQIIQSNEKLSKYNPNFIQRTIQEAGSIRFTVGDRTFKTRENAEEFQKRLATPNQSQIKNANISVVQGADNVGFVNLRGDYIVSEPTTTYISQKGMTYGPQQPREDPLSSATIYLEEFVKRRKDPVSQFLGGIAQGGVNMAAGAVELQRLGGKYFVETVKGKKETGTPTPIKTTETVDTGLTSGIVGGTIKGVQSGRFETFVEESKKGFEKSVSKFQSQPLALSTGQIVAFVTPLGGEKLKALSPIKSESFKAVQEGGQVTTVIRTVDVGYGSKKGTVITKTAEGVSLGGPLNKLEGSTLGKIEATDRGLELTTQGRLGTKVLTSEEGLDILQRAGKVLPRDVKSVQLSKEVSDIIKFSAKNVPNDIRQKAQLMPKQPVRSLRPDKESIVLSEEILPSMPPIKGTLSETVQLDEDLIKINPTIAKPAKPQVPQTPETVTDVRSRTTEDIDIDFPKTKMGEIQAGRARDSSIKKLSQVAEPDRKFFAEGTNVFSQTRNEPKQEVLNILTKKDEKTGYLNKNELKPFGIKLKERLVRVKASETSGKKIKFVSLEQNTLNRIESTVSIQGPKTDKFKGETKEIPYLAEKFKEGGIQRTEKGYTVLPTEHRLKDISKLYGQNVPQIGRNLIKAGYVKEGKRALEIAEEQKRLYPEVEFGKLGIDKDEVGFVSSQSKLGSVSSAVNKNKEYAYPVLVSGSGSSLSDRETIQPRRLSSLSRSSIGSRSSPAYGSRPSVSRVSVSSATPSRISSSLGQTKSFSKTQSKSPSAKSPGKSASVKSASVFKSPSAQSPSAKSPGKSAGSSKSASVLAGSPLKPSIMKVNTIQPVIEPIIPTRKIPLFDLDKNKKKKGKKEKETHIDFLGNTRTNAIEGLFRRTEIIRGDKRTERQVKIDKKATFNPKFGLGFSNKKKLRI